MEDILKTFIIGDRHLWLNFADLWKYLSRSIEGAYLPENRFFFVAFSEKETIQNYVPKI